MIEGISITTQYKMVFLSVKRVELFMLYGALTWASRSEWLIPGTQDQ